MSKFISAMALSSLLVLPAAAGEIIPPDVRKDLQITIYNSDSALISETRPIALKIGRNEIDLRGIAAQARPETILLPDLDVEELRFLNNMPSLERLYSDYIGKEVTYIAKDAAGQEKEERATIIAVANGMPILKIGNRIELDAPGRIILSNWPENFQPEPSLLLNVTAKEAGSRDARLLYLSRGLSWSADYVAILSEDEKSITLTGYASIQNSSGTSFKHASLRLVSGQVAVETPPFAQRQQDIALASAPLTPKLTASEGLSDYHLYTMPDLIDLNDGELKQLSLVKATQVPVEKEYLFSDLAGFMRGSDGIEETVMPYHATISIKFNNRAESNLGKPLPTGTARLYSQVAGGSIFLGENTIGDIPVGEKMTLLPGKAFDVTARVKQTAFKQKSEKEREIGIEMEISNARASDALIVVTENVFGDWRIDEESEKHFSAQRNQVGWRFLVPANGSKKLTYKISITNP